MKDELTLTLNSPLTEEQWDMITDVDFDYTNEITFHTKHGKEVKFVKASAQQWIPVSERLPDMHDEVLVTARGEVSIAWLYVDGKWRSNDMPQPMFKDIIAWMPLPEPYKGE